MGKIKVLFLDHAPYIGGAEVSLQQLLTNLNMQKFELVAVTPPQATYSTIPGVKKINFNYNWKYYSLIFPLFFDLLKLLLIIKKERPDIVHANTRVTNIALGVVSSFIHSKTINHIRDVDPIPGWKMSALKNVDLILCNSENTRKFLGTPPNSRTYYNGFDVSAIQENTKHRTAKRTQLQVTNGDFLIGSVGQIYPRKGFKYLISAFAELSAILPRARLVIIGDDPASDHKNLSALTKQAENLKIENKITFLGFQKQILEFISAFDLFVLPSLEEPFGRVLVEAQLLHLPVIATRVGGIPEIIEDQKTGLLVKPQNTDELCQAMHKLTQDARLLKSIAHEGFVRSSNLFDLRRQILSLEKIYSALIEND